MDCLPVTNRWGKGIWEGIPDGGVEVSRFGTGRGLEEFANVSGAARLAGVSEFLGAGVWGLGTEMTLRLLVLGFTMTVFQKVAGRLMQLSSRWTVVANNAHFAA